jgi:hypothetical protein
MGCPVGSQQCEGIFGQRNIAVFSPFSPVDMDLEALAIDIGDLEVEGFMEPESQAVDGGEVDLIVQGGSGLEQTPNFFHTEDGGEAVCGLSPNQRQDVPIALEDVLIEKSDTTVADAHGSWGEAIDVFAVQEIVLELLFGEQVGRFAIELSQQTDLTDIGLLSPFAFATELECGNHLPAQWSHEISPFLS